MTTIEIKEIIIIVTMITKMEIITITITETRAMTTEKMIFC